LGGADDMPRQHLHEPAVLHNLPQACGGNILVAVNPFQCWKNGGEET